MPAPFDPSRFGGLVDTLFDPAAEPEHGVSLALVVLQDGRVVAERYGRQPDTPFSPGEDLTADSTLISWSMAKSITHALVGICVGDGLLDPAAPAPVAAWHGDARREITLQDLLTMRSGLHFVEDYVDGQTSHVIDMLFGAGSDDVAGYAAGRPLEAAPGTTWGYSSGTTNIVCRIVGDAVAAAYGPGDAGMTAFMRERLFDPIGMRSAVPKFDAAGTFIGSSFVYATARDFARFGELYRNDGMCGSARVLPPGWVDHARTPTPVPNTEPFGYGAHWWLWRDLPGSLACHGYEGQRTLVVPDRELVLVRLGKSTAEQAPNVDAALAGIVGCFAPFAGSANK